jgi:mannose-6-phosphate isomerase-like protein (cupin superfamily)
VTGAGVQRLMAGGDAARDLRRAGMHPDPWSAGPGTDFAVHTHERTKHLYCVSGSIAFWGPTFDRLELGPGEGVVIPSGTAHHAMVGAEGVSCVEGFMGGRTT